MFRSLRLGTWFISSCEQNIEGKITISTTAACVELPLGDIIKSNKVLLNGKTNRGEGGPFKKYK